MQQVFFENTQIYLKNTYILSPGVRGACHSLFPAHRSRLCFATIPAVEGLQLLFKKTTTLPFQQGLQPTALYKGCGGIFEKNPLSKGCLLDFPFNKGVWLPFFVLSLLFVKGYRPPASSSLSFIKGSFWHFRQCSFLSHLSEVFHSMGKEPVGILLASRSVLLTPLMFFPAGCNGANSCTTHEALLEDFRAVIEAP